MPLLYSMLGEPFTVTETFVRSGLKYFSESLVPAAYGSTQRRRMPFRDLLWGFSLRFILVSVTFGKVVPHHMTVKELLTRGINTARIVRQRLASHLFILQMDFFQLVLQF